MNGVRVLSLPPMKNKDELKVVRITVEYSDGSIREATGKNAVAIMKHWKDCETMAYLHGQEYKGPFLKVKSS